MLLCLIDCLIDQISAQMAPLVLDFIHMKPLLVISVGTTIHVARIKHGLYPAAMSPAVSALPTQADPRIYRCGIRRTWSACGAKLGHVKSMNRLQPHPITDPVRDPAHRHAVRRPVRHSTTVPPIRVERAVEQSDTTGTHDDALTSPAHRTDAAFLPRCGSNNVAVSFLPNAVHRPRVATLRPRSTAAPTPMAGFTWWTRKSAAVKSDAAAANATYHRVNRNVAGDRRAHHRVIVVSGTRSRSPVIHRRRRSSSTPPPVKRTTNNKKPPSERSFHSGTSYYDDFELGSRDDNANSRSGSPHSPAPEEGTEGTFNETGNGNRSGDLSAELGEEPHFTLLPVAVAPAEPVNLSRRASAQATGPPVIGSATAAAENAPALDLSARATTTLVSSANNLTMDFLPEGAFVSQSLSQRLAAAQRQAAATLRPHSYQSVSQSTPSTSSARFTTRGSLLVPVMMQDEPTLPAAEVASTPRPSVVPSSPSPRPLESRFAARPSRRRPLRRRKAARRLTRVMSPGWAGL